MQMEHGFLIADPQYLVDLYGLLRYCMGKVIVGGACLNCSATFSGFLAAQ
jgi:hypothetical protein